MQHQTANAQNSALTAADLLGLAGELGEQHARGADVLSQLLASKISDAYSTGMAAPLSRAWSDLPKISEVAAAAARRWSVGAEGSQTEAFERQVDGSIRSSLVKAASSLRELGLNPTVRTDTLQDIIGNLMYERDKAIQTAETGSSGIAGVFRRRVLDAKVGELRANFATNPSPDAIADAVTRSAGQIRRELQANNSLDADRLNEIDALRIFARRNASPKNHQTTSHLDDLDRFLGEARRPAPVTP